MVLREQNGSGLKFLVRQAKGDAIETPQELNDFVE